MIDWVNLVFIAVFSVWLTYMNWLGRMKKSNVKEVNPIWALFDKAGFKRIQFIVIPIIFLSLGSYFSISEETLSIGFLLGILFLNVILDSTTLHFKNSTEGLKSVSKNLRIKMMRRSFLYSFLACFFLSIFTAVAITLSVGIPFMVVKSVPMWSYIIVPISTVLFIFLSIAPFKDLILFRRPPPIPKDGGIPIKP